MSTTFEDTIEVEEAYDGWRLDKFLTDQIPRVSRTQVQEKIVDNVRLVPPRPVKPALRLRTGDTVVISRKERVLPNTPDASEVRLLWEAEDSAVVYKPPGILVHRTSREVTHTLDAYLESLFSSRSRVEATHRLDRDTSGCVLCGLSDEAVSRWRAAFQRRQISKTYLALVHDSEMQWRAGQEETIDIPLGFAKQSAVRLAMGRGELSARTDVRCKSRFESLALLEVRIHEGRQHQIRVHLSLFGTPIVGDKLYGRAGEDYFIRWHRAPHVVTEEDPLPTPFHCLHARSLRFEYGGQRVEVHAPLPGHFEEMLWAEGSQEKW
jgi:23S rRNA pseudouridine1911/1915/1917 synthase